MNRNEDLSENLNYTIPDIPVLTSDEYLSELPTYKELMHWHEDFEFILVTDGILDFDVNGEILHINTGHGLFINSERLHYGFSAEKKEVLFKLIIVSPRLIQNRFNSSVITSLSSQNSINYLVFHKNMLIWSLLERIHSINKNRDNYYVLELQSELCMIIKELSLLCTNKDKSYPEDITKMKQMIHFIQEHFYEKISVYNIASSAMICRNQCFKLFQQIIQMTPQQYLMQYRINQSIEMMKNEKKCMAEVAQSCGFCSQSHYTKVFRSLYGVTPKQYQKNMYNY